MFDVPAREALGVHGCEGALGNVVPVGQQQDRRAGGVGQAEVTQRQVHALVEKLVVLVVAVDEHQVADTLLQERAGDVPGDADQAVGIEAQGAPQVVSPAGLLLGFVSVVESLGHLGAGALGRPQAHGGREQAVGSQGEVGPVLFERSHGDQDCGAFVVEPVGEFRCRGMCEQGSFHACPPFMGSSSGAVEGRRESATEVSVRMGISPVGRPCSST